ncbi:C2H2-type zinc finger protein [Tenacibaculum aiptasiae]|uniref:C2H2-type zinc finger protein n=1 Tax=Tenacibaculum aiptasiae TaxID=426481 RepID=UPI0023304805|nr:C2H2-type zinc finger protein [Tenacibaculum aiptasiae]
MNYILEDKMTSLRAVSIAVLLYILGYALKISVLLIEILTPIISNTFIRLIAAGFTGLALSTGLLIVSVNDKNKYTPYVIGIMDALMLLLVFNVLNSENINETMTSCFISFFMAFIGYQLIAVFVTKYKETKSELERTISEIINQQKLKQQELIELEQELSEKKQTTCDYCGKEYKSINALNAHRGRCKQNPNNL